jgi:(4S)-4-hydroxy-5-phosphonooxypentane-2,3-dione isomerase
MYHIVVSFEVPASRREEFIAAALEDGRNSETEEPGTYRFELIEDENDPNRFYLDEAYEDIPSFETHVDGRHFKRFFELIESYAQGPTWLVKRHTVVQS